MATDRYHRAVTRPYGQPLHPPQPAGHPAAPAGPPLVVDIGRANTRRLAIAWVLLLTMSLSAIICGVAELANDRLGGLVAAGFGGLLLVLLLVGMLVRGRAHLPKVVVVERAGIRWDDRKGRSWAMGWQELAAVALTRHEPAKAGPDTLSEKVADVAVEGTLGKRVFVHLELYPADPYLRQRRPELAHLWHQDRLRLQLGFNAHQLPRLAAALQHFQPGRFLGIQRTLAIRRFR